MEQFLGPDLDLAIWPFVAGLGLVLAVEGFRTARTSFLKWRLQRRMDRDPYLSLEEKRDYEWEIARFEPDEDASPLRERLTGLLLELGGFLSCFALGRYLGWDVGLTIFAAFGAFGIIAFLWNRLNAPPDRDVIDVEHGLSGPPEIEIPDKAIWGFVGAIMAIGLIVLFAWVL